MIIAYKKISNYIKQHFLLFDLLKSILLIIAIIFIANNYLLENEIRNFLLDSRQALYSVTATIAGAILGFVITGVAIIIGLGDEKSLSKLKRSKYHIQIYEAYFKAIIYLAITTFLGITGIIIHKESINLWLFYANLWGILISVISVSRCIYFLKMIVKIITSGRKEY